MTEVAGSGFATAGPTASTRVFLRLFGPLAQRNLQKHPQLPLKLARARNPLVPSAYLASVYGQTGTAFLAGAVPAAALLALGEAGGEGGVRMLLPMVALPFLLAAIVYSWGMLRPDLAMRARRRSIEANLPYALNFMAALASAGVVPNEVFGALGSQAVYGEVAQEANLLYRDTRLFSRDLVTALQAASRRSPSPQFEEFLQGSVNTITSGGDLTSYFLGKAQQFSQENHRKQKAFLESLGVMAESYVVVAAAAPLFLIVILSVMMLLTAGIDPIFFLNALALLALPVIHAMFAYIFRSMRPES